jgi:hypothetical protein
VKESENWRIVAGLAGASMKRISATLLGVSNATVSKVMPVYTQRSNRRKSTLIERDYSTVGRTISKKKHRTTAAQVTAELNAFFLSGQCFHTNCMV